MVESRITQGLSAKTWRFLSFFSKTLHFCLHLLKVEEALENRKILSGSFPIFDLYNHTTFSQKSN
jgi:hypothetical protein